jgi:hypothetical protein
MSAQCKFMRAAYPILDADDTCYDHRHDEQTFALARAMAEVMQQPEPSDEQIAWFLNDAGAVVDDFIPVPSSWSVSKPKETREPGLDLTFRINGIEYVIQENDSGGHVESHPVSRATWDEWMAEANT